MSKKQLLKVQGYLSWLCADTSTQLLGALRNFIIPLICLNLTGNPIYAGFVAAAGVLAEGIFDFIGGIHADKWNRIKILVYSSIAGLLVAGSLFFFELFFDISFAILLIANIFMGARSGYSSSSSTATLVDIVPEERLGTALSANQTRDAAVSLTGGPVGGILLNFGTIFAYSTLFILEIISLLSSILLRKKIFDKSFQPNPETSISSWNNILIGFRWIFTTKGVSTTLIGSVIVSFSISAFMITNIYSMQLQGENYQKIGLFSASLGAGMLIGSLVSSYLINRFRPKIIISSSFLLILIQIILNSLIESYYAHTISAFLIFFLVPSINVILMSYLILLVPDEIMGRVNSAASLINLGSSSLSPIFVGFILYYVSRPVVLIWCSLLILIAAIFTMKNTHLMGMPCQKDWAKYLVSSPPSK